MKRHIALLAGTIIVSALTFANAGSAIADDTKGTDEKTYRDEDLSKSKIDEDRSIENQMEQEQGEGSAAGGVRDEYKDKMKSEKSDDMGTVEKMPATPDK